MESFAPSAWSEIIAKAATSPLGIAALMTLVVGIVIVSLVKPTDKPHFRLLAIIILMIFCGGLMGAAIYSVRPTVLPPDAASGAQTEGPSQQPPAMASQPPAPAVPSQPAMPPAAPVATRNDCGTAWTGWVDVGGGVGNPCPGGCTRGAELGQSYRVVGFPPRPQTKHKFQCWRE